MFLLVQGYKNIPLQHCWVILSNLQTSVQESSHFHWFPLIVRIFWLHRDIFCVFRAGIVCWRSFFLAKCFLSALETQNLRCHRGKGLHESVKRYLPFLVSPCPSFFLFVISFSTVTVYDLYRAEPKDWCYRPWEWVRVCVMLSFSCLKSLWGVTPSEWAIYPATCSHSMMYFCLTSSYKLTFCYRLTMGTSLRSVVWCRKCLNIFPLDPIQSEIATVMRGQQIILRNI